MKPKNKETQQEQEQTGTGKDLIKESKEQEHILNNYTGQSDIKSRPTF